MKETTPQQTDQEVEQRQVKKGLKHDGSFRLKPGQRIWQLDLKDGTVEEAVVDKSFDISSGKKVQKLVKKENHLYMPALNKANAIRKFDKIFIEAGITLRAK